MASLRAWTPLRHAHGLQKSLFGHQLVRHASLNSAIERGVRRSQRDDSGGRSGRDQERSARGRSYGEDRYERGRDYKPQRPDREGRFRGEDHSGRGRRARTPEYQPGKSRDEDYDGRRRNSRTSDHQRKPKEEAKPEPPEFDEEEFIRTGSFRRPPPPASTRRPPSTHWDRNATKKPGPPKKRIGRYRAEEGKPERVKPNVEVPSDIHYSSSASEFVYGTNAVEAAIRCGRRKMYILYIYQAADEDLTPEKIALRKLALAKGVQVKMAFGGWSRLLDKMSKSRPHNGCVLEASPLPQLPVVAFREVPSLEDDSWGVSLGKQSAEEAAVNGMNDRIVKASQHRQRYPVVLLLDGIVDPGNLGAIIRSAYFLGIDGIAFAGRNAAPLSGVATKASAGAAENMPFFKVSNEVAFIKATQKAGWRFYAADAPAPGHHLVDPRAPESGDFVTTAPSVIMLGSEASGLSKQLTNHADTIVSIPGLRHDLSLGVESDPARVDSLNVSVAAALLLEMFMGVPLALSTVSK